MKINLLIIGLLFSFFGLYAQPIITRYQPSNTETYWYYNSDTAFNPGSAGANILWDFSNLSQVNLNVNVVTTCNFNPDCADFPGASYFIGNGGSGNFYINDSTAEQVNGQIHGSATKIIYTDPQIAVKFPMVYLDGFTDTFAAYYASPAPPNCNINGYKTTVMDGYGTLKTPEGTYTNVLRLKTNIIISYSATLGFPQKVEEDYLWYQAGISHAIMRIFIDGTSGQKYVSYANTPPKNSNTSVDDMNNDLSSLVIYPNPATDFFNVKFEDQDVTAVVVKDILGRTMFKTVLNAFHNKESSLKINTVGWPKGIYLVEAKSSDHSSVKKVIIK